MMNVARVKTILDWYGLRVINNADIVTMRGRKLGHLYASSLKDDGDADTVELTSLPISAIVGPDQEKWVFTYLVQLVLNTPINMNLYKKDETLLDRIGKDDYNDVIGKFPEWFFECVPTQYNPFDLPGLKLADTDLCEPWLYSSAGLLHDAMTMPSPDYQIRLDEYLDQKLIDALEHMFEQMVSFSELVDLDTLYEYLRHGVNKNQQEIVLTQLDELAILWANKYAITHSSEVLKEQTHAK